MEGEKVPLLCIGTAANPRWPTVLGRRANDPVPYTSSKKGWMTRVLSDSWLTKFERNMHCNMRRALLLLIIAQLMSVCVKNMMVRLEVGTCIYKCFQEHYCESAAMRSAE